MGARINPETGGLPLVRKLSLAPTQPGESRLSEVLRDQGLLFGEIALFAYLRTASVR